MTIFWGMIISALIIAVGIPKVITIRHSVLFDPRLLIREWHKQKHELDDYYMYQEKEPK